MLLIVFVYKKSSADMTVQYYLTLYLAQQQQRDYDIHKNVEVTYLDLTGELGLYVLWPSWRKWTVLKPDHAPF